MALQTATLRVVSDAFRVHPRTILRALEREHNTYWYEDSDHEEHSLEKIAKAYGMKTPALIAVIEGRDKLLSADEAAVVLGIAARTFRKHLNRGGAKKWGRVGYGGITRYLHSKVIAATINNSE